MKKMWKTKWLKALRSGNFKQTKEVLHSVAQDSFCCLGVLCQIAKIKSTIGKSEDGKKVTFYDANEETLSGGLMYKFGLTSEDHDILTEKNDKGVRFKTIANWIERKL